MSKTIKIEDKVYTQLDRLRGKRETFSDVVAKLLVTKEGVDTMIGLWSNRPGERKYPGGEVDSLEEAYRQRDDLDRYIREHTKGG